MKNLVCMTLAAISAAAAFAAGEDQNGIVTFYSAGPDKYLDGTTVLDNEFYALVWVRDGASVPAYSADATLLSSSADCKILAAGPWASCGGCGAARVKKDGSVSRIAKTWTVGTSDYLNTLAKDGSFRLCLLDTRKANDAELSAYETTAAGYEFPKMVNGYVTTAELTGEAASIASTLGIKSPIVVDTQSSVPSGVAQPKIVKMEFRGEGADRVADVWVECTVEYLRYTVAGSESPSETGSAVPGAVPADGDSNPTNIVKLTVPAAGDSGFFRVIRK